MGVKSLGSEGFWNLEIEVQGSSEISDTVRA